MTTNYSETKKKLQGVSFNLSIIYTYRTILLIT